jgi:hypothetical protein
MLNCLFYTYTYNLAVPVFSVRFGKARNSIDAKGRARKIEENVISSGVMFYRYMKDTLNGSSFLKLHLILI